MRYLPLLACILVLAACGEEPTEPIIVDGTWEIRVVDHDSTALPTNWSNPTGIRLDSAHYHLSGGTYTFVDGWTLDGYSWTVQSSGTYDWDGDRLVLNGDTLEVSGSVAVTDRCGLPFHACRMHRIH